MSIPVVSPVTADFEKMKLADPTTADSTLVDAGVAEDVEISEGTSKIKFLLGIMKKLVGVKDLASMRLSLPGTLMKPESNLEFWSYMDRPDLFVT
ncbi:hypothetical protein BDK51DRAFT_49885 [Blyttiomyces helicus]|uniref:Uncharacterized protein n=1 Tax=Blyttiomyces helicus TaxID=388810 RepID=A0A4P9VV30_9FUNG|nr:hypothetical protein BDK51DRAFT_49885 [Blyttiomyces helicus]|eukprot:RKO82972.1 hypothetical protein BDK51DRAFT_49885 [Blyttiomyces helicus]